MFIYSGICLCGHIYADHHIGIVMSVKVAVEKGTCMVPDVCCRYGCNEDEGLDRDGNVHCFGYVDREEPDEAKRKEWQGTAHEVKLTEHEQESIEAKPWLPSKMDIELYKGLYPESKHEHT